MMARTLAQLDDGAISNVFLALADDYPDARDITDMDPMPGIGWREAPGGAFIPPPPVESPQEPPAPRLITRRALRSRFTIPELVGIEIASLDDPAAPIDARQTAATLRVLLATLNSADFIDLDFSEARLGVQMIGQFGLLSAERVTEILDTPVDDSERP